MENKDLYKEEDCPICFLDFKNEDEILQIKDC